MQVNKNGILVQAPTKKRKRVPPNLKLEKLQMTRAIKGKQQEITIPDFQPLRQVLTAYGWELREV